MATLKELYVTTRALYDHLQEEFPGKDDARDTYITTINQLLDEREQLMQSIPVPASDAEKKVGNEVLRLNESIQKKLQTSQQRIQTDINSLSKKKKTGRQYENPYGGPTPDGVFFDSKK